MDVGQYIANEIHRCANAVARLLLAIPLSSPIFAAWQGWTFLYPFGESNTGPKLFLFSEVLLSCSLTLEVPPATTRA